MAYIDCLLVSCPRCGRWPMSVNESPRYWAPVTLMPFRCQWCGYHEKLKVTSRAAEGDSASPQPGYWSSLT